MAVEKQHLRWIALQCYSESTVLTVPQAAIWKLYYRCHIKSFTHCQLLKILNCWHSLKNSDPVNVDFNLATGYKIPCFRHKNCRIKAVGTAFLHLTSLNTFQGDGNLYEEPRQGCSDVSWSPFSHFPPEEGEEGRWETLFSYFCMYFVHMYTLVVFFVPSAVFFVMSSSAFIKSYIFPLLFCCTD